MKELRLNLKRIAATSRNGLPEQGAASGNAAVPDRPWVPRLEVQAHEEGHREQRPSLLEGRPLGRYATRPDHTDPALGKPASGRFEGGWVGKARVVGNAPDQPWSLNSSAGYLHQSSLSAFPGGSLLIRDRPSSQRHSPTCPVGYSSIWWPQAGSLGQPELQGPDPRVGGP